MKPPICDIASENAIICAIYDAHDRSPDAARECCPVDFYDPINRAIYEIMVELSGSDWDPNTLIRRMLATHGKDLASKAMLRILELQAHPFVFDLRGAAQSIADASRKRHIVNAIREASALAEEHEVDRALELLQKLSDEPMSNRQPRQLQELLLASYNVARTKRSVTALTSVHCAIDSLTGGMQPGDCWVVGGGTSEGKSSYVIAVADENLKHGKRVLIVSIEDRPEKYGNRILSRRSGVDAKRIRDHNLDPSDHSKIATVIESAPPSPVLLHGQGEKWERLSQRIDATVTLERIDLVVLDYVQECETEERFGSRMLELQSIARSFRAMVRRRGCCGIICSQLTGCEPGQIPSKQMARECKDIVNGAEVVLLLYSVDEGPTTARIRKRYCNVDKSKDGNCGIVELDWDDVTASYKRVASRDDWVDDRYETELRDIDDAIGATSINAAPRVEQGILF